MNRSQADGDLLPELGALQHEPGFQRAPRPLPLFLALVAEVAAKDPDLARAAVTGLRAYSSAPRAALAPSPPQAAESQGSTLRDHGGDGPPVLLVPSLINAPRILDLDEQVSLVKAVAGMGRHVFSIDWSAANKRSKLSVSAHVEELLLPLLRSIGEPTTLLGYCLGGTMALAAAQSAEVKAVVTIAAPWHFSGYPKAARDGLRTTWEQARTTAEALGALPMEVLQAAFWSLDPERTVRKFARFAEMEPASPEARRFVQLEDWANEGEPLPYAAARELIEDLFDKDLPGSGQWHVAGALVTDRTSVPALHLVAERDRIAPAGTAPRGPSTTIAAGHVGMVVGSKRDQLHQSLARFFNAGCR